MTKTAQAIETLKAGGYFSHKLTDGYHGPKFATYLYTATHARVLGIGAAAMEALRSNLRAEVQGNCVSETRYHWTDGVAHVAPVPTPVVPKRAFVVRILDKSGCALRLATPEETAEFWAAQPASWADKPQRFRETMARAVLLSGDVIGEPHMIDG